ncbi:MAG TPA: hypothetical protein VFW98_18505 [Gemmatimonadaceae bacterium]|nr:hypothetical protein [Gemmatimonadaceae bacterium]
MILGTDAILAALPATAVQVTHACMAAGYAAAIPASWGDELVAARCVHDLAARGSEPAILCTCPLVAARVLDSELTPFLVPVVAPPIAAARYLRALHADVTLHITYVGNCPSALPPDIDVHRSPAEFLSELADRGIAVAEQPLLFESVLPPDRRRFYSLPGGAPAPTWLAAHGRGRALAELTAEDYRAQLAEQLLSGEPAVVDLAPRLHCPCSGAADLPVGEARAAVMVSEPPRAPGEVIDARVQIDLDRPLPPRSTRSHEECDQSTSRVLAPSGATAGPAMAHRHRRRRPARARRPAAQVPQVRRADGRIVPRAYLAQRRAPGTPSEVEQVRVANDAPPIASSAAERSLGSRRPAAGLAAEALM